MVNDDLDVIDLEEGKNQEDQAFNNSVYDLSEDKKQMEKQPGWHETIDDILTQTNRGFLKVYTWPADVLKLGMIGEGLSDLDELEDVYKREGKPFDREKYIRGVFETAQFIPDQTLLENLYKEYSGNSLEPKTGLGKSAKQVVELASFNPANTLSKKI